MENFTYLIIGGGMAADAAVSGIREIDLSSRIGIIGLEEQPPYNRPPLTKGLWFGETLNSIWRKTNPHALSLILGRKVLSIDISARTATDDNGNTYSYQKLLLTTGGLPKQLDCPNEGVIYFRTIKDYQKLKELYSQGDNFVIIGGGFIGTELAAALSMNGKKVTLIFRDSSLGIHRLPKKFSQFLNALFTEKGVHLIPQQKVVQVKKENARYRVHTDQGEIFTTDGVVAGLGITPNTELARSIDARIENGIVVNHELQTSIPEIWAAGDVANFYSPHLDKRIRIEHEDAALSMGKTAGRNMAGAHESYTYLPYFYSDLFDLGYEAIGEISSDMEMVEEWIDPYRQGAIYYLREGKLLGAMVWNIWHQMDRIREMIASKETFRHDFLRQLTQDA